MSDGGFASPLLSLIDDGVGLLLGTADADNVPRGTRAWGVRVVGDRTVRVTFSADDGAVVENTADRVVALTGADVRRLRSAQLKGRVVRVEEPDQTDLETAAVQTDLFFQAIFETDRHEVVVLTRMLPVRMLAAEIEISDAYDQTPGPAAGAPLESDGSAA